MPLHKKRNKQAILTGASSTMAVALALVALVMTSANTSTANSIVSLSIPPFSFQNAYGDSGDNRNQDADYDEHGALQQSANNGVGNVAQIGNGAAGTEVNSASALQGRNQQRLAQQVDDNRANNIADDDDDRGERSGNARSGSGNSNSLAAGIGSTVLAGTIAAIIGAAAYTAYRIVRVKQKRMALVKGGSNNSSNAPPS
jgi:hypothetical protein